jgi:hypothetical protein
MAKWRKAAKVDAIQPEIVEALEKIPGITVETGHDDILVGYQGRTYWYELKSSKPSPSQIKPDQYRIWETFTGHYKIAWSLDQILEDIGIE